MGTIIPLFFSFLGFKLGLSKLLGGIDGDCKSSLLQFAFSILPNFMPEASANPHKKYVALIKHTF
jgi:hypothetical protein